MAAYTIFEMELSFFGDRLWDNSSYDSDEEEHGLLLRELPSKELFVDDEDDVVDEDKEQSADEILIVEEDAKQQQRQTAVDPHATELGGSLTSATFGIIKGMVGPAILYLPHGFASAGYLVAIPVLFSVTLLFLWSSSCLLQTWKVESDNINRNNRLGKSRIMLSYPELAFCAFGEKGMKLVQVGISLMQSGVCLTYLIFVPQNLHTSAKLLFNWDISTNWTLTFMMAMQIPLSWIRDIRRLTVTNCLANGLILYGLATCLAFAANEIMNDGDGDDSDAATSSFTQKLHHRAQSLPVFNPSGWYLFIGTSVLLFEGSITLLVPLQEAVSKSSDRETFPILYRRVIICIVSFYTFFGLVCWIAFGNDVRTVMTTSLPPGTLATTVQLAYSLAVVFTFPLQNFPSLEIVCDTVERMLGTKDETQRNIISSIVIIVLSIVAKGKQN